MIRTFLCEKLVQAAFLWGAVFSLTFSLMQPEPGRGRDVRIYVVEHKSSLAICSSIIKYTHTLF